MGEKEHERIVSFDFTYNNKKYSYEYGDILGFNELGHAYKICEIDISHTNYANNIEVLTICCHCALYTYSQAYNDGISRCKKELRDFLGIKD